MSRVCGLKTSLKLAIAGLLLALVVIPPLYLKVRYSENGRLHSSARREWKTRAISQINEVLGDKVLLTNQINTLHANAGSRDVNWVGSNVLVMTNGEWLVYRNVCAKEEGHIFDFFLARGSNGKWYFSTFHFCVGMITLRIEPFNSAGSGSIGDFATTYFLREFDGSSDDCLEKTWPIRKP